MWEHKTKTDTPTEQDIVLNLTCGILIPLSGIKHAFKTYCWEHGLRVEFSQCGFLQRDVTIKVSGRMTDAEARSHKAAMMDYFRRIGAM